MHLKILVKSLLHSSGFADFTFLFRSTLQKSVPGLRAIDSQETDSFFLPPAVQQVSSASDCFLTFCQAQLQQTQNLQQHHSREHR